MEACTADGDCPKDSKCTIRGCDGSICLCRSDLIPNLNYTKCVSIAEVGQSCTSSKFCRPVSTRCDHEFGRCACQNGYLASNSNSSVTYCKQKPLLSTSTSFSLLNEFCDNKRLKCSPENHLECDSGTRVCVCTKGYKKASIEIINAYPFNVVQCVPLNFSIGIKIKEDQCFSPPPVSQSSSSKQTIIAISLTATDQFSSKFVSTSDIPSLSTDFGQTLSSALLTSFSNLQPTPAITTSAYKTQKYTKIPEPLSTAPLEESISFSFPSTILPWSNGMESFSETKLETQQTVHHSLVNSVYTKFISDTVTSSENYEHSSSSLSFFTTNANLMTTYLSSESKIMSHSSMEPSFQYASTLIESSQLKSSSPVIFSSELLTQVLKSPTPPFITSSSQTSSVVPSLSETVSMGPSETGSVTPSLSETDSVKPSSSAQFTATTKLSRSQTTTRVLEETTLFSQPSISSGFASSTVSTIENLTPFPTSSEQQTISSSLIISPTPTQSSSQQISVSSVVTTASSQTGAISTTAEPTKRTMKTSQATTAGSPQSTTSRIPIGEVCERNITCPANAFCEKHFECGSNLMCYCKHSYVPSDDNKLCLKIQYLGGKCASDKQCVGPNTVCVGGSCSCKDGYISSSNGTRCRREMSWFVSFPLLGDRCMGFLSSCYNHDEQECKNKKCSCKGGYRELVDDDLKLRHKNYQQCIKNNTDFGNMKRNIRCTDITASEFSDPYDSEANRKIRVMQGAIIGGVIALIVLTLAVVGVILYIRYKKRTGDMNNDSGSEISFERQSSGRYSFRIPRPFATYDSTPADNLSFHNRSFKDDETHRLREDELKSLNGTLAKFYFDDIDYKSHEDFRPHEDGK
ncbi:serine-rich adhesin for platelets-like [Saccostrea echinata]|uniref:serine-rich adhesin for platelets-like n=1 Tax=Saccostrea echinata TaxID=191078 RepID=UPI002A7F6B9A|nr:serine-rich adhesin for platelets-like [Saccostrea echinata]